MGKKPSLRAEAKVDLQLKGFAYCDVAKNIDGVPSVQSVRNSYLQCGHHE